MVTKNLISSVDIGNLVMCDICSDDYTNSDAKGGFLFGSKGICPICAPRIMKSIVKAKEQYFIKGLCPQNMSFKEWIVQLRNGNNKIEVFTEEDVEQHEL